MSAVERWEVCQVVRKRGGALMEWGEVKRVGAVEVCTK